MWKSLDLKTPPELTDLASSLSDGLHSVKTYLQAAEAKAAAAEAFMLSSEAPSVAALNTLLSVATRALEAGIDALLDTTGAYVLLVPLPKKGLLGLLPPNRVDEAVGSNFIDAPVANLLADIHASEEVRNTSAFQRAFSPDTLYTGGNAWFLRTLGESLFDAGDENRPQFDQNSYYAYVLLVTGAQDLSIAAEGVNYFTRLLGGGRSSNHVPADRGATSLVPQNVRVAPSARETRAVLSWDLVPSETVLAAFGEETLRATEYAIIRSSSFRARNAMCVRDLFPSGQLTERATGEFGASVVAIKSYDGVTRRFVDPDNFAPDVDYFYHVAFRTSLEDTEGHAVDQGYDQLSSCAPFRLSSRSFRAPHSQGTPPDWWRTPSVAHTVPAIGRFFDKIREKIATLRDTSQSASSYYRQYLEFLSRQIDKYDRIANDILKLVEKATGILSTPSAGVYAFVAQGQGNVGTFMSDVTKALSDESQTDRPPFDNGTEYVAGAVLLAVAPSPDAIVAAYEAFELFFGGTDDSSVAAVLSRINAVAPTLPTTTGTPAATPETAFDAAMNPTSGPDAHCSD